MDSQPDHEARLRETIRKGLAVIVAGTGVSIAASYDPKTRHSHPQASWSGLLEDGLLWLKEHRLIPDADVDAYLQLLNKIPPTHRLISAAEDVTEGMGSAKSKHFADWLKRTVGSIKAHDRTVLVALNAIRKQGNLLATTNYDGLLLETDEKASPVTWRDTDALMGAVLYRDVDKIIFLHGYWRQPESVVLDWKSYERIARDEPYREDLAAFWKTNTWVYVGCGVNGIGDPDFGLLLESYADRARQAGHWDYCLVRDDQRHEFQAHFDSKKLNIRAISFGQDHPDLPKYLQGLLPVVTPETAPNPRTGATPTSATRDSSIPIPPAFYAVPDYSLVRHKFVGRRAQLQLLSDWAKASDPTSVLLFEAIGGSGKSMLTWEWTIKYATVVRSDWAGRFWYSFYEKGAVMRDFCQHALAYMTQKPLDSFEKKTTPEMRVELLARLHQQPWLLILDGLERVLVAYHRLDAAEVPDEEVNRPTDKILDREPCDAIRDEDTDLLRALATAAPSKVLISSRLMPRVLLNPAGFPLPGVKALALPGLDEVDGEELLRSCGIQGASADIRYYLTTYCGNHPLVISVLAGLINSPGPHRGNFDAWATDPAHGAKLNLASLDLIQSRNHILLSAFEALEPASRQLLSTLALISNAVDYETVAAFDPHLVPMDGEGAKNLAQTINDLEDRGLLQYDPRSNRYDLHPVVRGVAAGGMKSEEKERYGQRVVDYFSSQPHNPYEQARTMEDLENGLHVVRILLQLGHYQQAVDAYRTLANPLLLNLEGIVETLSLLSFFFTAGWDQPRKELNASDVAFLANQVAIALTNHGENQKALGAYEVSLRLNLKTKSQYTLTSFLNIARNLTEQNLLAASLRLHRLALTFATELDDDENLFISRLLLFYEQAGLGQFQDADATWRMLDPMGRNWNPAVYRQGMAESLLAWYQFLQGTLEETRLSASINLAKRSGSRKTLRRLLRLSGLWRLERGEWELAAGSFDQAVTMARDRRILDEIAETGLALSKLYLGQLEGDEAKSEAERLARLREPSHHNLARLWLAIGDFEQAKTDALKAYEWAWADGEPYVHRYELTKATELLKEFDIPKPNLPPYDPTKDIPFSWEADIHAAIEELRARKQRGRKS
jgi:hypothetical protein